MTAHSGRGQGDESLYEGVVLPANGEPWTPEQQRQVAHSQSQPPSGQPWGQPWGPASQAAVTSAESSAALPPPPHTPPAAPPPPAEPPAAQPQALHSQDLQPQGLQPQALPLPDAAQQQAAGAPYQPVQAYGSPDPGHLLSPQQGLPAQAYAPQQPPAAPDSASDATQYIPPVFDAPAPHMQPQPGHMPSVAGDADATQMLPPQTGQPQDQTTMLRSPLPPETGGAAANGQYGTGQGHGQQQPPPPAGFESLFRAEPSSVPDGRAGEPGSTQSLPIFDHAASRQRSVGGLGDNAAAPPAAGYANSAGAGAPMEPGGRAARRNAERGGMSKLSPAALIAIGVVVVAAVGMAAGAALSSGGGDDEAKGGGASPPAKERKAPAGPDPVKVQAQELDKLLNDSNNSRTSVIRSVENIKSCKKLGEAARDLRAAAGQRNGLVKRLGELEKDKIPAGAELTAALTRAWKSSASADNHYATWADQTAGKKGCKKGKARVTAHTGMGTRASGEATTAKKKAAGLWNPTAKRYGLKERQFGQL